MQKSVIFMQASVKMNAVLNCYEAEKAKNRKVSIVLSHNLRDTRLFVDSLHLDAEIIVLGKMTGKYLFFFPFFCKKRIKRNMKLMGIDNNTHFFFTDVNDIEIGLMLPYLKNCDPTQIQTTIDINDGVNYQTDRKSTSNFRLLLSKLLSFFYNTHFIAVYENGCEYFFTDMKAYNLPTNDCSDKSVINKYMIKYKDASNCVIFYTSPFVDSLYYKDDYNAFNKEIVDTLHKKGYKVFAKSHPRFGDPEIVKNIADMIIPSYIPGEYIDISSFLFAIGLTSTVLATSCEVIPSYSVIKAGKVKDERARNSLIKYITDINPGVVFLYSLDEIPDYNH